MVLCGEPFGVSGLRSPGWWEFLSQLVYVCNYITKYPCLSGDSKSALIQCSCDSEHWSRAKEEIGMFLFYPVDQLNCGEPACQQWTDNLLHTLSCSTSTFGLTCVLECPRSNKPRVHHVCVFIVFVSDELLAATRLQWGDCYANNMWQGYTELTQSQTFSPFSLFFTSFSLSVSEPSWQQLCGRKTLRRCFSMSLQSTVIQLRLLLPIVTSRDSFNMLLVSRDSAKILWQCESNDLLLPQNLKPAMRLLLWFEMS